MKNNNKNKQIIWLAPGVPQVLNYQCIACGAKYGTEPNYCHGCGCNRVVKIEPCNS